MTGEPALSEADVHEALENLGDSVSLAQVAIVAAFPQLRAMAALNERARALRSLLLEAIEAVGPERPTPFGSLETRSYDVLTLRYIERLSVTAMADELTLSRRQIHRDLRQAEGRLKDLLGSWAADAGDGTLGRADSDIISEELALFSSRPVAVDLTETVREALATVSGLAGGLGVSVLTLGLAEETPPVVADKAYLGQLLVQALSIAVQCARGGSVSVDVEADEAEGRVRLRFQAGQPEALRPRLESLGRMAAAGRISCAYAIDAAGGATLSVGARRGAPVRVLVVEDNPGAIELYRRFLSSGNWQVQGLADPRGAYDVVRTGRPDVVLLDVMMPHLDGWKVLRALKQSSDTADVPVVVCSIVDDPALAQALGAAAYLTKPVSQAELVTSLRRVLPIAAHR